MTALVGDSGITNGRVKFILFMGNIALAVVMYLSFLVLDFMPIAFAAGLIAGIAAFQSAYRSRHGHWFDIDPHPDDNLAKPE